MILRWVFKPFSINSSFQGKPDFYSPAKLLFLPGDIAFRLYDLAAKIPEIVFF